MERRGYIMKCPMPNQSKIWSQPLNFTRRTAPTVGFTVPKRLNPQGQESDNTLPDVGFRTPSKFLKAPNGCVSTLYMRERLYEVKFPWSNVQIHLEKNQFADQVDRYG
jgi:hypothetical protein